jgi:hypothetical protein
MVVREIQQQSGTSRISVTTNHLSELYTYRLCSRLIGVSNGVWIKKPTGGAGKAKTDLPSGKERGKALDRP